MSDVNLQLKVDLSPAVRLLPEERNRAGRRLAARLVPGYLTALVGGALFFRFGAAFERGNEMSVSRSVFTAVNALTLTGFQQDIRLHQVSTQGAAVLFALTLVGTLFALIVGGLAVTRILRLHYADRQIVVGAFAATLIAVLVGTIGVLDRDLFEAMFLSLSAFGNSGLYIGRFGSLNGAEVHGVLLPLAFCGGLGLTVLMELFDRVTGIKALSVHARTVLTLSAGLYLGFLVIFLVIQRPPQGGGMEGLREPLLSSSAAAVNLRGAGLPIEYANAFPRTMQWVVIVLMAIGGNSGGTASGLKPTTLVELLSGIRSALRGGGVRRAFGIAAAWTCLYLGLILGGFLLLVWRVPDLSPDRLLFLTFSAASNVGLSHDPISITGPGLYALASIMLLGRLAPLLVLWWMVHRAPDAEFAVG